MHFTKLYTKLLSVSALLTFSSPNIYAQTKALTKLESPDHQTIIQFSLNEQKQLVYKMQVKNHQVTEWSALGLETNGPELSKGISIKNKIRTSHKEIFDWALGENAHIENNYHQLVLKCHSFNANFDIIARAYNGSFAFRYAFRGFNGAVRLKKELTSFVLADSYEIYQYHEESIFRRLPIANMPGICDLPATLVSSHHLYLTIGEAENRNDTKSVLIKGSESNSLALNYYIDTLYRGHQVAKILKDTLVTFRDSLVTPWRTISCAESAIGLHKFSELNLKLVEPLSGQNPVWVKPGKVFRVPISTEGGIDGVDFAKKMNFQYILLDAGWYGAEFKTISDPTNWIAGLDLPGIISYAQKKGIGVILYVNYVGLKAKLDTLLPLYKKWGVSGLKFGFVDGGTQMGISWLDSAMKKVNDFGMILNVHDHYKPTGLSRRYPFNLSQEGIRGDENSPDAFHTMVLPYTRYLAGPADFTFCYPNKFNSYSKNLKVSKGHQMALTVVYFDPLQSIFWYGRSQDYQNDKEVEFFKHVPTVWDETRYLQGEIGESISVARRHGDTWFVGSATGLNSWSAVLQFDFLKKHQDYMATIYEDNKNGGVAIRTLKIRHGQKISLILAAKCGQAMILRPHHF